MSLHTVSLSLMLFFMYSGNVLIFDKSIFIYSYTKVYNGKKAQLKSNWQTEIKLTGECEQRMKDMRKC